MGVALGPVVSVIVGVKTAVGVRLAVTVKLGKKVLVATGCNVGVSIDKTG